MSSMKFTNLAANKSDRLKTAQARQLTFSLGAGGKKSEQLYDISHFAVAGEESAVLSHLIRLLNSCSFNVRQMMHMMME